jgi:hypothetical protein
MSDSEERPLDDVVANHRAKQDNVRRAWIYASILMVALVCISILTTLLLVRSEGNVNKLSEATDAQIDQFEYCQTAPKNDPKCQDPVSEPATKIVEGPRGLTGMSGERGEKGEKGDPGTPCLPSNPQCRGPRGVAGPTPTCMLLPTRCQGAVGRNGKDGAPGKDGLDGASGKDGLDGTDGVDGKDGVDGTDGVDGKDGQDGAPGKDGAPGPTCEPGSTPQKKQVITTEEPMGLWVIVCVLAEQNP